MDQKDTLAVLIMSSDESGHLLMAGETHGYKQNFAWQLWWIKELYEKSNVRQILMEVPAGYQFFIDKFMNNGKVDELKKIVFQPRQGSTYSTQDFLDFMVSLRKWIETLPPDDQVKIIAVDAETDPSNCLLALLKLVPDGKLPSEIKDAINIMVQYRNEGIFTKEKMALLVNQVESNFLSFTGTYKQFLGDDFPVYASTLFSLVNSAYYPREIVIYQNILYYYSNQPWKGNSFGQFGALHCAAGKSTKGAYFLGQMLNAEKKSPFKKNVHSVLYLYEDEETEEGLPVAPIPDYLQSKAERSCKEDNFLIWAKEKKSPFEEMAKQYDYLFMIGNPSKVKPL